MIHSGGMAKTLDEHRANGTFRPDRHARLLDLSAPLFPKPAHLPPSRRTVSKRWIQRWKRRGVWSKQDDLAIKQGCWFDVRLAEHFRQFCRQFLCLWEGRQWAGKPFELMEWQWVDVFARLFGWQRWDAGWNQPVRRFDRVYIEVGKKNGKSPMAAAVGCYFLAVDGESGGKVFSAAAAKEQASIVHSHAVNMIMASPRLHARCKINRSTNSVTFEPPLLFEQADIDRPASNNIYRAISSESATQEGLNGNACICDELHAWYGRKLWDSLHYMFESRLSPLLFCITTAGDNEQSVCFEQHEYAEAVQDGHIKDIGYLSYIRAADKTDPPGTVATWKKANPSLGVTITPSRMRLMYNEAAKSTAALNAFRRYRLNIWLTALNVMIDPVAWDECYESFGVESLAGQDCFAGLDLSKSGDMTALALLFPDGEEYRQLVWFWLPEEVYNKNRTRAAYAEWIEQGWLELCPGARIDEEMVESRIVWCKEHFDLQEVCYDPYRAAGIVKRLEEEHGIVCVEFPQTLMRFAGPTADYESLVARGKLHHNDNGCLTWQSRHITTKSDANRNERPVKPARGDIRTIDGIVAGIMGLGRAQAQDSPTPSVYEERGLIVL